MSIVKDFNSPPPMIQPNFEYSGHLHVACEWGHDVDVEAGHLVQAVEHHRILPGEDRNGNWTVAESKFGNEYQNQGPEET